MNLERDRKEALKLLPVSRETVERCEGLVALLLRWQRIKNLVGPGTLEQVWTRHIVDSLQLAQLAPSAKIWVDIGSGAGFPGLVLGCAFAGQPGKQIHLVEANGRKVAFLREAARTLGLPVTVHDGRIEDVVPGLVPLGADIVTARALASLTQLLAYCSPLMNSGAEALFLKGQDLEAELTEAAKSWNIETSITSSCTDAAGRIVRVRSALPVHPASETVRHDLRNEPHST